MKKIFLALLVCLVACEAPSRAMRRFTYAKDPRTSQCFVLYGMGTQSFSMSYVPCTEEVEKAIKEDAQK